MLEVRRQRVAMRPQMSRLAAILWRSAEQRRLRDADAQRILRQLQERREALHRRALQDAKKEARQHNRVVPDRTPLRPRPLERDTLDRMIEGTFKVAPAKRQPYLESRLSNVALAPARTLPRQIAEAIDEEREIFTRQRPSLESLVLPSELDRREQQLRPLGWARVLRGEYNCPLCIMLASRGPVYRSNTVGTRYRNGVPDWSVRLFHPNCDCDAVLVYDEEDWEGREEYLAASELYAEATKDLRVKGHSKHWRENYALQAVAKSLKDDPKAYKRRVDYYHGRD